MYSTHTHMRSQFMRIFESQPKECEMAFCIVSSVSWAIFYFIFSVSRLKKLQFCKYYFNVELNSCFTQHDVRAAEAHEIRCKTERESTRGQRVCGESQRNYIMHGLYAIQCDCGFLFAANKTHYSHILCVIFIECVCVPQLLSFNFQPNPK